MTPGWVQIEIGSGRHYDPSAFADSGPWNRGVSVRPREEPSETKGWKALGRHKVHLTWVLGFGLVQRGNVILSG